MTPPARRNPPRKPQAPQAWAWEDGSAPSAPIRVEGGLTARSTRGGIGREWWSRRFIEVMESMELGGRLTRGRNYARKGQVISLDVAPGEVTASVQGSRVTPYRVRIALPTFTGLVWAKVEVVLAEQAIHSARLLAGQFPPELEPVFAGIGAPLFPARISDLTMTCSCPDYMIPCKHLAAAFYLLAERFDDDPFLILLWRGRSRQALLDRLRELRSDEPVHPERGTGRSARAGRAGGAAGGPGGAGTDGAGTGSAGTGGAGTGSAGTGSAGTGSAGTDGAGGAGGGSASAVMVPSAGLVLAGLDRPRGAGVGAGPDGGVDGAGAAGDFWTARDVPGLPVHARLPVDFLLRQLPVPGPALGGSRLLAQLSESYEHLSDEADR